MKKKMFIAGMSFVVALVMLATASFAWFTLSQKPEVSGMDLALYSDRTLLLAPDVEGKPGDFQQYISLSDNFYGMAPLRPVSTVDGVNWFLPAYDTETGELAPVSEFVLDNTLAHANIRVVDDSGNKLEDDDYAAAERNGYYVYTDFWMKTEEDGAQVRLSVPHSYGTSTDRKAGTNEGYALEKEELTSAVYGTYVLGEPELDDNTGELTERKEQPETAIRVGFLVYQDESTYEAGSDNVTLPFAIYEPNAEKRVENTAWTAEYVVPNEEGNQTNTRESYISGYDPDKDVMRDGNYIVTNPIALGEDGKGMLGTIDPANLIVQTSSEWDVEETVKTLSGDDASGSTKLTSNNVAVFGQFLETDERFAGGDSAEDRYFNINEPGREVAESMAGSRVIVTLKKDTPIKVRLFVWIEGQDADCWNDIAAGTFRINLELAGESLTEKDLAGYAVLKGNSDMDYNNSWFNAKEAGFEWEEIESVEFTKDAPRIYDASWNAGAGKVEINAFCTNKHVFIVLPEEESKIYLPADSSRLFADMCSCGTIEGWDYVDTSKVTTMSDMFSGSGFSELDLSTFRTSNVTDMSNMFCYCGNLRKLDVSGFNTSNVTKMYGMFDECCNLQLPDITGFDTSKVTDMSSMFYCCQKIEELDLTTFDTSRVTNMNYAFSWMTNLETIDLTGLDFSKVTEAEEMFSNCEHLTTIYSGYNFNLNEGMTDTDMFAWSNKLVGANGTEWDINHVNKVYGRVDRFGLPGYFTREKAEEEEETATAVMKGYGTDGESADGWFVAPAGAPRSSIKSVTFTKDTPSSYNTKWNAGTDDDNPINAYLIGKTDVMIVVPENVEKITFPSDSEGMFKEMYGLETIEGLDLVDTS